MGSRILMSSPWSYLSGDIKIDMGKTASTAASLFNVIQTFGILVGMLLSLWALVSYIMAQSGRGKSASKEALMNRIIGTLYVAGAVFFLSLIMEFCKRIFGA